MPTKPYPPSERAYLHAIDAFVDLSRIYLDCAEHLTQSTLALSREALEQCAAASKSAAAGKGASIPAVVTNSLLEKMLAYTKDGFETVTNAQMESAHIIGQQFSVPVDLVPVPPEWKGAFDQLTRNFRDFSTRATATFVEASDAARTARHGNKAA